MLGLTFLWVTSANGRTFNGYDQPNPYANPVQVLPHNCSLTVRFFRVSRLVLPLVPHVFVGASVQENCGSVSTSLVAIYGASKGQEDWDTFEQGSGQVEDLGEARDANAVAALNEASRVSLKWQEHLAHPAELACRILLTPLLGRPCANATAEVTHALEPYLTPR